MAKPKKKLEVQIVYTNSGVRGLENQTRYNTDDIMAILNHVEHTAAEAGNDLAAISRFGAVLVLTDNLRPVIMKARGAWNGTTREIVNYPSWIEPATWQKWNSIQITPPEMLHTNVIEALSWDGLLAPPELGGLLQQRFEEEMGVRYDVDKPNNNWEIRVEPERQSKKRGVDAKPYLQSVCGQAINRASSQVSEALWALYRTDGIRRDGLKVKLTNLGAVAELAELEGLITEIEAQKEWAQKTRSKLNAIENALRKYAIPNRSK